MPPTDQTHPGTTGPITPLPAPAQANSLVLVGGTFDPPHRAHIDLPARVRDAIVSTDAWLLFVPAARSPLKDCSATTAADRVALVRIATAKVARAAVWTDEIDRAASGAPSYWIDTLRRARALRPDARLWFVIGTDQAAEFHRWREPREILALADPIVLPRAPITTRRELREALGHTSFWSVAETDRWLGALADVPPIEGSATRVRQALARGESDAPALSRLLDPAVLEAIRAAGLYGVGR